MSKDYYAGGKRVSIDGAPCKVAAWVGELGNDREALEATRPRSASYKAGYYEGGVRAVYYGVPVRLSAVTKSWTPRGRAQLLLGSMTKKEEEGLAKQMELLFPEQAWAKKQIGWATCTCCRQGHHTSNGERPPCWDRHLVERVRARTMQVAA